MSDPTQTPTAPATPEDAAALRATIARETAHRAAMDAAQRLAVRPTLAEDDVFHATATAALDRRAAIVAAVQRGMDRDLDPLASGLLPGLRQHVAVATAAVAAAKNDVARGYKTAAGLAEDTYQIEAARNAAVDAAITAATGTLIEQARATEAQLREAADCVTAEDREAAAALAYETGPLSLREAVPFLLRFLTQAARDDNPGAVAALLPLMRTLAAEHDAPELSALVIRAQELAAPWQVMAATARLARIEVMQHELRQIFKAARAGEPLYDTLEFRAPADFPVEAGPPITSTKRGRRLGQPGLKRATLTAAQRADAAKRKSRDDDDPDE